MPKLPTARQSAPRPAADRTRVVDQQSLAHAFLTFTQAAGSLEKSYAQLQAEVGRLRADLEVANGELSRSLEENSRVRVFLGRVLEGLPCGVLVTGAAGEPRMANPEARRLLELEETWRPETPSCCPDSILHLLSEFLSSDARTEREWAFSGLAGPKSVGVSATHVESAPGEFETIWILRDISEQKRTAAEREAARRTHALAEIATVLAHEIRNPLGSMELFAGLLAESTTEMPEANQWVIHLQAGLRSLSATVNNVLQFHSQPCGELLPVSLERLLRETAAFLRPLATQRGLAIQLPNFGEKATVAADAHRLQQVFLNLALNAFHAMPPGGSLTMRVRRPDVAESSLAAGVSCVQVDFEDDGCGIDSAAIDQIFEPGFTTRAGSPGLGLSVCRQVVEQHRGRIEVHSSAEHGTTFSLLLPLLKGSA
jgi:two-component system sensor histidine kinase FlrB